MTTLPFDTEVNTVLALAKAKGLKDVEVFARRDTGLSIKAQKGELESFNLSDSVGVGLRVLLGERVGYAYTENLQPSALERALDEAAANAELVEPMPGARLADDADESVSMDKGRFYDPNLDAVPVAEKIAKAVALEKIAYGTDARIKTVPYSSYADGTSVVRIANTKGVNRAFRQNSAGLFSYPIAHADGENKVAFEQQSSRKFQTLDPQHVAAVAAQGAVHRLGAREPKSGRYPVVFSPHAMTELLATFAVVFSAKAAQEGKSLLAGKQGQSIASPIVQLVDDPFLETGFASRPFDDEGVPSRRLTLIENGVFRSFLHNTQTAAIAGVDSTAHAARGSYKGTVDIAPSNFAIQAGTAEQAKLVGGDQPVILIDDLQGLHAGTNAISGDFSLAAQGYLFENGQEVHPVHNFTVAGNFFELLRAIEALGDDLRYFSHGAYIGSPSVRVSSLAIAGA